MKLVRRLAVALVAAAATVGLGELGARLLVERSPRFAGLAARDWYHLTARAGWERRPGYRGKVYGVERGFDERGILEVDRPQLSGSATRVVLLGDSCTFGHRVATDDTFAEVLDGEDGLGDRVDVINLGVPGYSSFQALAMLELALELEPDVVVFATNFNDRRYVRRPEDARNDWGAVAEAAGTFGARLKQSSRLVGVLRELTGRAADAEEPRPADGLTLQGLAPRVSPARYREHLEAFVERTRAADVTPVLLLLGDAPEDTAPLDEGRRLRDAGDVEGALGALKQAADGAGMFALVARGELVELLEAEGRTEEARAASQLSEWIPSLHGGKPLERDAVYHAEMRAVAADEDVLLVDGKAALRPGDYFDFCHFGAEGNARVAKTLARAFEASGIVE